MALLADVIFCDEIRQEVSGKFILIGMYTGDLLVSSIPAEFPMAIMIRVHGYPKGEHDFSVTVTSPTNEKILEQRDTIEVLEADRPSILIFNSVPMSIEGEGDIVVTIAFDGKRTIAGKLPTRARKREA